MNSLKRRHFLQFAGSTFVTIGISQFDFFTQAGRTARVLAQPTGRKLALLIGINNYPSGINRLSGCLTDVEMQYELLRYRYGFKHEDILILTDETKDRQPNRQNILTAFEEHLIKQAKPGDVVVFHYSGHGSLVTDPQPLDGTKLNGTLLPNDCTLSNRNDIMGRTLFLLSSQIQTDYFTMVLDSCHSGGGTRGNQVIRALVRRDSEPPAEPSKAELEYQQTQLKKLGWSSEKFQEMRRQGIAKGVAIGSAKKDQLASDASFGDFHAGALTYLLTRYLWQLPTNEPLNTTFDRLALVTRELAASYGNPQEPIKEVVPGKSFDKEPVYQLTSDRPNAEGVVRQIRSDGQIEFWLGGVSSRSLDAFQPGSLFSVIDDKGKAIGEIEQTRRAGLVAYGQLKAGKPPQAGTLLREKLRRLPENLSLKVGLDPSLGADREAIAAALKQIPHIESVPVNQKDEVNFIIGRMTDTARSSGSKRGVQITQPNGSVGLFTPGYDAISNSFGRPDEPASSIVSRLRPQLKMLLARQVLTNTLNGEAAQLKVNVDLKSGQGGPVQVISTGGARSVTPPSTPQPHKANSVVNINVTNQEDKPIYLAVLSIGDDGVLSVLHPATWDSPESASIVKPGTTPISVPMQVYGPAGFFEVLVITSASPLRETLQGLQAIARGRGLSRGERITFDGKTRGPNDSEDSILQATNALVRDITTTRAGGGIPRGESQRKLDPKQSGVFSAILQVVD